MKKTTFVMMVLTIITAVLETGCASADFTEVPGKDWKLTEVYVDGRDSGFSRSSLSASGIQELFTLRFDSGMISGTGAPNRYNAPYTVGESGTINIEMVRATLMAPIGEMSSFREYVFFNYLQSVYKWNIVSENLVLYSKYENSEIRLVFSL